MDLASKDQAILFLRLQFGYLLMMSYFPPSTGQIIIQRFYINLILSGVTKIDIASHIKRNLDFDSVQIEI
jgi:hypothetical protein